MSSQISTTVKYKCPECGLVEEERYTPKESKRPIIHICWFCLMKGLSIEMEVTKSVE